MTILRKYLTDKRSGIARRFLSDTPDLDLGAGKSPKARLSLDIKRSFRPSIVADLRFLPFKDSAIGSLICSHVMEHIPELSQVMRDIARVLKRDGIAVFFVPNEGSILWRFLEPVWTVYYERLVSAADSPKSHVHHFDKLRLHAYLMRYLCVVEAASFNVGMELYAVCRKD